jgi:hypothetical protein
MSGARRRRRGAIPRQPSSEKDGAGQSDPQRTGLRRLCPDLPSIDERALTIRTPAALPAPGATPGNGDPVNKGPPHPAAGLRSFHGMARACFRARSNSRIFGAGNIPTRWVSLVLNTSIEKSHRMPLR